MANDTIDNRTNMIRTTVQYDLLPASVTATAGIPAYGGIVTTVKTKLILIDQLNLIANGTSKGVTLDTKALKQAMCFLGGRIGQALAAYASSVNNNTLFAAVDFTEDKLMRIKKDTADDVCEGIHTAGTANLVAAGPFGYTAGDLTALLAAIALYRTGADDPRQAIISKSQAIEQIEALQQDIINNLFKKQLDKMAYTLRNTPQDAFYKGHKKARVIVDLANVTGKISVKVVNSLGQPLKDVVVTVTRTDNGAVVKVVNTNDKGAASITKLFGEYNITYERADAQPQGENNINIGAGKKVQRVVTMIGLVAGHPVIN